MRGKNNQKQKVTWSIHTEHGFTAVLISYIVHPFGTAAWFWLYINGFTSEINSDQIKPRYFEYFVTRYSYFNQIT